MEDASTWLGGLDVLVNNAGVGNFQLLDDHKPEIWQKVIDVNLTGAYHGMITAVPLMKKSGGGAIVNNSSGSGVRPIRRRASVLRRQGRRYRAHARRRAGVRSDHSRQLCHPLGLIRKADVARALFKSRGFSIRY